MLERLFSEHNRWQKVGVAVTLVGIACLYCFLRGPAQRIYAMDCLGELAECRDREVLVPVGKVIALDHHGFMVKSHGVDVSVLGNVDGLAEGRYIDVAGVFQADGALLLQRHHIHRERRIKILVSLPPLLIVLFLLYRNFLQANA